MFFVFFVGNHPQNKDANEEEILLVASRLYGDLYVMCPTVHLAAKLAEKMSRSKVHQKSGSEANSF